MMKFCFLFLLIFCFASRLHAQTDEMVHYESGNHSYSFDYPKEWDSSYLSKLKAKMPDSKMILLFASIIKPAYRKNGIGGIFMINVDTFPHAPDSAELVMLKENDDNFFTGVDNGKLEYSKLAKTKKSGLPCFTSVVKADFSGIPSYVYSFEIFKGSIRYTLTLNCHEIAYLKLKEPFEKVAETFE